VRDERLKTEITRIYQDNHSWYGLPQDLPAVPPRGPAGSQVRIQRLMGELGIAGLVRSP
jgi:putative transposase